LRLPFNVKKPKVFQLQGVFALPDPLSRDSALGPRWGLRPQTPVRSGLTVVLGGGPGVLIHFICHCKHALRLDQSDSSELNGNKITRFSF